MFAGKARASRQHYPLDATLGRGLFQHLKTAAFALVAELDEFETESGIRSVRTEALHRLRIGNPREDRRGFDSDQRKDAGKEPFHQGVDVLLTDERRFDIDLGEFRLPVRSQILIPKAAGDLHIAAHPRNLKKLFEELGRLRKGVKRSLVESRRDQEIARTFGCRSRQNRGLHLEEVHLVEKPPGLGHNLVTQHHICRHFGAPQIEVAVGQPQFFGGVGPVFDDKWRRLGGVQDKEFVDAHLDCTTRKILIGLALSAVANGAANPNDILCTELFAFTHHLVLEDQLQQPAAVTKVDEDQTTEIPTSTDPTHHFHSLAHHRLIEGRAPRSIPRARRHAQLRFFLYPDETPIGYPVSPQRIPAEVLQ